MASRIAADVLLGKLAKRRARPVRGRTVKGDGGTLKVGPPFVGRAVGQTLNLPAHSSGGQTIRDA